MILYIFQNYIIASSSNSLHIRVYKKHGSRRQDAMFSINVDADVHGLAVVMDPETTDTCKQREREREEKERGREGGTGGR